MKLILILTMLAAFFPMHAKADWTYYVGTLDCDQTNGIAIVRFGTDQNHQIITFESDYALPINSLVPKQNCTLPKIGTIKLEVRQGLLQSGPTSDPTGNFYLFVNEKPIYYNHDFTGSFLSGREKEGISEIRILKNKIIECPKEHNKFVNENTSIPALMLPID